MATAIREETENPWVSVLAYGTASVVGWSPVRAKRHWTSDVVAGAIVGTTVTQATMRWLHREPRDIGESEAMRYRWVVSFSVPGT
jgi:undecaprenyl-diphosphatase